VVFVQQVTFEIWFQNQMINWWNIPLLGLYFRNWNDCAPMNSKPKKWIFIEPALKNFGAEQPELKINT
jgi:hypothetical protein